MSGSYGEGKPVRVEIYQDSAGEWRFRFRASNGELFGDGYTSKRDAQRGVGDLMRALGSGGNIIVVEGEAASGDNRGRARPPGGRQ